MSANIGIIGIATNMYQRNPWPYQVEEKIVPIIREDQVFSPSTASFENPETLRDFNEKQYQDLLATIGKEAASRLEMFLEYHRNFTDYKGQGRDEKNDWDKEEKIIYLLEAKLQDFKKEFDLYIEKLKANPESEKNISRCLKKLSELNYAIHRLAPGILQYLVKYDFVHHRQLGYEMPEILPISFPSFLLGLGKPNLDKEKLKAWEQELLKIKDGPLTPKESDYAINVKSLIQKNALKIMSLDIGNFSPLFIETNLWSRQKFSHFKGKKNAKNIMIKSIAQELSLRGQKLLRKIMEDNPEVLFIIAGPHGMKVESIQEIIPLENGNYFTQGLKNVLVTLGLKEDLSLPSSTTLPPNPEIFDLACVSKIKCSESYKKVIIQQIHPHQQNTQSYSSSYNMSADYFQLSSTLVASQIYKWAFLNKFYQNDFHPEEIKNLFLEKVCSENKDLKSAVKNSCFLKLWKNNELSLDFLYEIHQ